MEFTSYEGIMRDSGTFKLDSATKGKLNGNPRNLIGKAVTFVVNSANNGEPLVGYGEKEAMIAGIVTAVEVLNEGSEDYVVTVTRGRTFDNIEVANASDAPVEGGGLVCNGDGKVKKSTAPTNAQFLAFDQSGKTAGLILVL